jgi:fermentation-respiration switch protein FrsA (DUF1100 family)
MSLKKYVLASSLPFWRSVIGESRFATISKTSRMREMALAISKALPTSILLGSESLAIRGGGMAALMTAASGDKRVRSVVSTSAPTDQFKSVEEKKFSAAHYPDRMRTRGTPPDEDPEYYRSISAIYHASKMRDVPIFLIHGAADFLCFVDHSLNMYGALKVAGNRQARLEVIPGAGHFFERGFSGYLFDEVTKLVVPWFDDTLKGKRRTEN